MAVAEWFRVVYCLLSQVFKQQFIGLAVARSCRFKAKVVWGVSDGQGSGEREDSN